MLVLEARKEKKGKSPLKDRLKSPIKARLSHAINDRPNKEPMQHSPVKERMSVNPYVERHEALLWKGIGGLDSNV